MANKVIQEVDILELVHNIGRKSKRLQAILLQEIEQYIDKDSMEYEILRKKILDETNNYNRAVIRLLFGDIEYLMN